MEKDDKGSTLIWDRCERGKFLLVPAYPGCPGSKAVKRSLLLLLLLVYVVCFQTYPFFLHFSILIFSLTYFFLFRINPLCFQAGCRKRRLNLVLVFVFIWGWVLCFDWWMHAFVVLSFFIPSQEIGFGKSLRNGLVWCWVGCKTTTQSINQSILCLWSCCRYWSLRMHQTVWRERWRPACQWSGCRNRAVSKLFIGQAAPFLSRHWCCRLW